MDSIENARSSCLKNKEARLKRLSMGIDEYATPTRERSKRATDCIDVNHVITFDLSTTPTRQPKRNERGEDG
jgi:hypothetical protein